MPVLTFLISFTYLEKYIMRCDYLQPRVYTLNPNTKTAFRRVTSMLLSVSRLTATILYVMVLGYMDIYLDIYIYICIYKYIYIYLQHHLLNFVWFINRWIKCISCKHIEYLLWVGDNMAMRSSVALRNLRSFKQYVMVLGYMYIYLDIYICIYKCIYMYIYIFNIICWTSFGL